MITQFIDIKIIGYSGAKSSDHRPNFIIHENFVNLAFSTFKIFPRSGKNCLCGAVSRRFGTSSGGISLYDINLTIFLDFYRCSQQACPAK